MYWFVLAAYTKGLGQALLQRPGHYPYAHTETYFSRREVKDLFNLSLMRALIDRVSLYRQKA